MRALVSPACIALCLSGTAEARLTETAKVRYETREGSSSWHTVDVTFMTGGELNTATSSIQYDSFKSYAIVFWRKGPGGGEEATVIAADGPSYCGLKFDSNCLPLLGRMKGPDQSGRLWEVCTGIIC